MDVEDVLARAVRARCVRPGVDFSVKRKRLPKDAVIFDVSDPGEIAELRRLLRPLAEPDDFVCMCRGDWWVHLLDAQGLELAEVEIWADGDIAWSPAAGHARGEDPEALVRWMVAHGAPVRVDDPEGVLRPW